MIPEDLIERARRAGAMGNVEDARNDLLHWPELCNRIINDLIQAIESHESDASLDEFQVAIDRGGNDLAIGDTIKVYHETGVLLGSGHVLAFRPAPIYDRSCIGVQTARWGSVHPSLVEKVLDNSM